MINFNNVNVKKSLVRSNRLLGRILRLPLRLIPKRTILPILQGPGKGLKWIVGSYNHGCWLGSYEFEKQNVLSSLVAEGDVVYDIGAHVGYFTIIFARLVGRCGLVVAFEPFDSNYEFIVRHAALNRQENVMAVRAGVGAKSGWATFGLGSHSAMGHKIEGQTGQFQLKVYNLVEFIRENHVRIPNLIKMDIEGAELEVIPSVLDFLVANRVKLLVSTHGDSITRTLVNLLAERKYKLTPLQWSNRPHEFRLDNATLISATL